MMKRKLKLKSWVKWLLLILLIIITITVVSINNKNNGNKNTKETFKVDKTKNKNNDTLKKKCKKINYCNLKYLDRYKSYKNSNKDLSDEDIITRVNLGLDYSFYTHTKETPYLNKEYILVNKYLHLNEDYVPEDLEDIDLEFARSGMKLVKTAKEKFLEMAKAAKNDNYTIIAMSSYRSYNYQVNLYNRYVSSDGVEAADTYSGRPGYSEHQTGLAVDVYDGKLDYTNFEKSDSYNWMQENAYKYGFILRFPKNKENITGYQYESWHYRYVGKKIAKYIHDKNITFEEYYVRFIEPKFQK